MSDENNPFIVPLPPVEILPVAPMFPRADMPRPAEISESVLDSGMSTDEEEAWNLKQEEKRLAREAEEELL